MKTKRFLAMILSLAMVLSLLPASMDSAAEFSGGDGAEGNPYKISTVEDLKQLASAVNSGTDISANMRKCAFNNEYLIKVLNYFAYDCNINVI